MKIQVFYVKPAVQPDVYDPMAMRFLESVNDHPDDVWPTAWFSMLRPGSGNGKDIGAFIEAAKTCDAEIMVCLGAHARINADGWLKRIVEVWSDVGPGLYAPFGSNEPCPHLRTAAFWCPPSLLRNYPLKVVTDQDRYIFELSPTRSITAFAKAAEMVVGQVVKSGYCSGSISSFVPPENRLFNDRFTDMQDAAR